jgi:flagellar hook protein FlgE
VYDSLGNPHTLGVYFVKEATPNNYTVYTNLDGGAATSGQAINFTSMGAPGNISAFTIPQQFVITTGGVSTLDFNLDLSNSTQYGSTFGVNSTTQDGYASGRLSGLSIAPDGTVQGKYSNGQSRNLAQVVLCTFKNPNGLQNMGGNQWEETAASGQPLTGVPGSGTNGMLQSSSVEESNTDLTAELVNMITQQRAYQANAQTIKTQDQILQTLVNLR